MVEHITESPPKIAFLGPGCSIAAAPVAETLPFWNVTEVMKTASNCMKPIVL
jgi:hypothetical protein